MVDDAANELHPLWQQIRDYLDADVPLLGLGIGQKGENKYQNQKLRQFKCTQNWFVEKVSADDVHDGYGHHSEKRNRSKIG
jgi:hypothetical protein